MHYGIAIELRADCQRCGQPIHVNALVDEVKCKACDTPMRLDWPRWKSLLEDAFDEIPDYELGRGGRSQSFSGDGNTNILYARLEPYCFGCKTDFDMDEVADADANAVACKECAKSWHVRRLPIELAAHFPGVELLLAEDEKLLSGGEPHAGAVPNAAKPIVFQCPSCSGALRVDGSERVIECEYCQASVYLPDDLWHRLHPRDTVRRWFLWWQSERARDASRFPVDNDNGDDDDHADELRSLAGSLDADSGPFSVVAAPVAELMPTSSATPARASPGSAVTLTLVLSILALLIGAAVVLLVG